MDLCLCVVLFVPLLQLHTDLAALADAPHIHDDCCCYTDPFSSTRACVCMCVCVCVLRVYSEWNSYGFDNNWLCSMYHVYWGFSLVISPEANTGMRKHVFSCLSV